MCSPIVPVLVGGRTTPLGVATGLSRGEGAILRLVAALYAVEAAGGARTVRLVVTPRKGVEALSDEIGWDGAPRLQRTAPTAPALHGPEPIRVQLGGQAWWVDDDGGQTALWGWRSTRGRWRRTMTRPSAMTLPLWPPNTTAGDRRPLELAEGPSESEKHSLAPDCPGEPKKGSASGFRELAWRTSVAWAAAASGGRWKPTGLEPLREASSASTSSA